MKKVYRIKLAEQAQPITVIADEYRVDGRTGLLQAYDILGRVSTGEEAGRQIIEPTFSAMGGRWEWVRKVSEVE
jgi:hypothetical protein